MCDPGQRLTEEQDYVQAYENVREKYKGNDTPCFSLVALTVHTWMIAMFEWEVFGVSECMFQWEVYLHWLTRINCFHTDLHTYTLDHNGFLWDVETGSIKFSPYSTTLKCGMAPLHRATRDAYISASTVCCSYGLVEGTKLLIFEL